MNESNRAKEEHLDGIQVYKTIDLMLAFLHSPCLAGARVICPLGLRLHVNFLLCQLSLVQSMPEWRWTLIIPYCFN